MFYGYKSIFVLFFFTLLSCSAENNDGWAPVARFSVSPEYVPVNTDVQVVLDARASCDQFDYPELCDKSEDGDGCPDVCPGGISYLWDIGNGKLLVGNRYNSQIRIQVNIARPEPVTLTVTDCDGNSASKTLYIGVTY